MAISSVGGAEATETPSLVSAEGTQATQPPVGSESAGHQEVGKPYAVINGQEFATQEDLSKWYDSRGNDTATGAGTEVAATGDDTLTGGQGEDKLPEPVTDDALKERLKAAGGIYADPKYEPYALEFEKSGGKGLSEESLAKAAADFGVPVEAVKAFMDGQIAQRQLQASQAGQPTAEQVATATAIVEVIPNEADYKALLAWGKDGLSADDRAAYDAALDRGDKATVKSLLGAFQAKFAASGQGKSPRDVTQEGAGEDTHGSSGAKPYTSQAQVEADMNNPQYAKDPAFRKEVQDRIAVSRY